MGKPDGTRFAYVVSDLLSLGPLYRLLDRRLRKAHATIAEQQTEIERLRAVCDGRWKDARLLSMGPGGRDADGNNTFEMQVKTGLAGYMAEYLLSVMKASGGSNYVEMGVVHPEIGPLTLTIQKVLGETPAQQLQKARTHIASLENALGVAGSVLRPLAAKKWIGEPLNGQIYGALIVLDEALEEARQLAEQVAGQQEKAHAD